MVEIHSSHQHLLNANGAERGSGERLEGHEEAERRQRAGEIGHRVDDRDEDAREEEGDRQLGEHLEP